jgi:hypothetical protein
MIDVQEHLDRIQRLRLERETPAEIGAAPAHPWLRYEVRPASLYSVDCFCGLPATGSNADFTCACGRSIVAVWPCTITQGETHEA